MNSYPRPLRSLAAFFGIDSWRAFLWVATGWGIVIALFAAQYTLFGTQRYLGWDTSTYVQRARGIQLFGPGYVFSYYNYPGPLNDYPNLYYFLVWLLGAPIGEIGFGERVLPILMGMLLVALYYRFGRELFPKSETYYAGAVAVLGALSPNTMRLMSDLHRNLFTLVVCLTILIFVSEISEKRRSLRTGFVWLVLLAAVASYSQIETFAVLFLAVATFALLDRSVGWRAALALATPLLVAFPFMTNYYATYTQWGFGKDPADPAFSLSDLAYYHGGVLPLLPIALLGVASLVVLARRGPKVAKLLLVFYAILMLLVIVLWWTNSGVPASRALYMVPVPVLVVLGIREVVRALARGWGLSRKEASRARDPRPGGPNLRGTVTVGSVLLLVTVATGFGLVAQKDVYLQPFISDQQYLELTQVGNALVPFSQSSPILVFAGYNGTWYYSIDEGYVGIRSGPVLGYFGRPQFLISLTDPLVAEPMLSNSPDPSRFAASHLYQQLTASVATPAGIENHPIVVATPGLYDRPVSDYFVVKHRVSAGLYIVTPAELTPLELTTWVWFAAYDGQRTSDFSAAFYPWALAPRVLEYVTPALAQNWTADYFMVLTQSVSNATLSLHLLDTPPFPGLWNVQPANAGTFTISIDGTTLARYTYGNRGVAWANFSVGSLAPGYHTITIQADDLGKPFGLALDILALRPQGLDLSALAAAYGP